MSQELENSEVEGKDSENDKEKENESVIPEEILKALPEKDRKEIMSSITQISGVFPRQNPLLKKITSDHITAIIQNANEEDKRDREERSSERKHNYTVLLTAIIAVLLTCGLFIYAQQLEFLKYIIGAIFGFAGGFGIGKTYKSKE